MKSLVSKIAQIIGDVGNVPKNGFNDFDRYRYATEADLSAAVGSQLAKHGIAIIPNVKSHIRTEGTNAKGNPRFTSQVEIEWTIRDGETGETLSIMMPGCADDKGDKSLYKSITGSQKYVYKTLFAIATGDDPERNDESLPSPTQASLPRKTGNGSPIPEKKSGSEPAPITQFPRSTSRQEFVVTGRLSNAVYVEEDNVFRAQLGERAIWVRHPELGQELLSCDGLSVTAKLRSGSKEGLFQLIGIEQ